MIKEIKIENFKSIQSLNLELGRLNVFIGANGSGKSNILEGIAVGMAAMTSKYEKLFLSARGVRITEPYLMAPVFKDSKGRTSFSFKNTDNETLTYMMELKEKGWIAGFVPSESSIFATHDFFKKLKITDDGDFIFDDRIFKQGEKIPNDILEIYKEDIARFRVLLGEYRRKFFGFNC